MTKEDILSIINAIKEGKLSDISAFFEDDSNCLLTTRLDDGNGRELLPIHYAALYGQLEIINYFLEKDPDLLNITDSYGETPLLCAAANGRTDVVNYFISKNADLKLATQRPGHKNHDTTPLERAMEGNHYGTANALILQITANQSEHAILPFIKNGKQALELMVSNPKLTNILLQDERVTGLIHGTPCNITEQSVRYYKQRGHRPSWFAEINRENQTSSIYNPVQELGVGTYGRVRLFQNSNGEKIGVKSLKSDYVVVSKEKRDRLGNELKREAQFNKAAYPDTTFSETFEFNYRISGQSAYTNRYVMPYVEGQTAWLLMRKTACPHQLAAMILEIARELDKINVCIIHGDLNPKNIIIQRGNNDAFIVRFIDFGRSYYLTEDSAKLWPFQTEPTWIAPELCTGSRLAVKPNVNQDVYGLGFSLSYALKNNPSYQELFELYPSITTFIVTSQRKTPSQRPSLQSFCEQLQNELQLKFNDNRNQTNSRPNMAEILKNHPLWAKLLEDSNSTAVAHGQKSNRI